MRQRNDLQEKGSIGNYQNFGQIKFIFTENNKLTQTTEPFFFHREIYLRVSLLNALLICIGKILYKNIIL